MSIYSVLRQLIHKFKCWISSVYEWHADKFNDAEWSEDKRQTSVAIVVVALYRSQINVKIGHDFCIHIRSVRRALSILQQNRSFNFKEHWFYDATDLIWFSLCLWTNEWDDSERWIFIRIFCVGFLQTISIHLQLKSIISIVSVDCAAHCILVSHFLCCRRSQWYYDRYMQCMSFYNIDLSMKIW